MSKLVRIEFSSVCFFSIKPWGWFSATVVASEKCLGGGGFTDCLLAAGKNLSTWKILEMRERLFS